MSLKNPYSQNQLRDYSSLFSRSHVESWLRNDFSSIHHKVDRYDKDWRGSTQATYLDYLKYVYKVMETHYQNEYIFKNSILNEWLIKEVGQTNSKVFSEYRVGNAIADLVMFNGSSRAFEIKTEYDSANRLKLQLKNYQKAFNEIYLIIPKSKLNLYKSYSVDVGLITFNSGGENKFEKITSAPPNPEVDPAVIMHILHTHEYKSIVKKFYGILPKMTSFNQFNKCSELIHKIPNDKLNLLFIGEMKKRQLENTLSTRYYKEFNQLSLALRMKKSEKKEMMLKLKSPLNT
ncbi:hypothetical protein Oweho_0284 [Owenweeksia hongkongensis DSM 17368]|uniref:Sce7726 family protein n=1 Tax=Owenweeksia hongkongensis (strain DSM 17368 / CIP 108786 / JCM 12287 / NRRL B-23963 / UST20020801) TaxID=926562 RepID=G8R7Y3_OWEHD|nr:sce7726 family protein [Owenweeksia hongkongensis]AEV31306.1 hypothetical protein Oweho_0284 [Owenweeksia hongkongensis DSM 17368]